jgi:transposase-like protein
MAKAISTETRAAAMAALLAGQGVNDVAREYHLGKATVSRLRSELLPEQLEQMKTQKHETLDDLILANLEANIRATTAIAEEVRKPEYLAKQPASDLAVLFGVMSDKQIRLLEAAQRGPSPDA